MDRRLLVVGSLVFLAAWTVAPSSRAAACDPCAVSGWIVSDDGAAPGWVVFDGEGILAVLDADEEPPAEARRIRHDGYVFPGLIDVHDHPSWNAVPAWHPGEVFPNRYAWQATPAYQAAVRDPFESVQAAGLADAALTYAEVRAIAGGTTMLQGTDDAGPEHFVRNLDESWGVISYTGDVTTAPPALINQALLGLQFGVINRLFLHVAEGQHDDPRTLDELPFVASVGGLVPGVVLVHGIALTPEDFDAMAAHGVALVWSPRSNLELYGETADVLAAIDAGVTVALGPDWTVTGSDNVLEELKHAYRYSVEHLDGALTARDLYRMVTTEAARVAGVDGILGRLEPGHAADLVLAPRLDDDPFASLLRTYSRDLRLVFVDGEPLYGDRARMRALVEADELDEVVIDHRKKAVRLVTDPEHDLHHDEIVALLDDVLDEVAPLVEPDPGGHPGFPRHLP